MECAYKMSNIYERDIAKQNPTSQFEKQGLGILPIVTFPRRRPDHLLSALPGQLPMVDMGVLSFWSSRCCTQI